MLLTMAGKPRVRIAPSPTGDPHIGTAYTALFNWAFARKNKGKFILRIEDTDQSRLVAGSEEKIYEALEWLGLIADEGPTQGGGLGPYRQSERLDLYKKYADELVGKGKAYWCDCSPERLKKLREEQQEKGLLPHYDGKCRRNPPQTKENIVVRLKVPREGETSFEDAVRGKITFKNADIDDQVLLKSDGFPTYHLANVVDDHLMEITNVIRGEEWPSSTGKHVLLYQAFGWTMPSFAHLPLLRNPDRSKLSKRKNPVSILWYRDQGYLPEALLNFLALMGWSMPGDKEIFGLDEFVKEFDLKRIDPAGPIFDTQKLDWLNGEYIRAFDQTELIERLIKGGFTKRSKEEIVRILPLVKERMKKLTDFGELTGYFFDQEITLDNEALLKISKHNRAETAAALEDTHQGFEKLGSENWVTDDLEEVLEGKQKELSWNKTDLFQTVRLACSGSTRTPPLGETLAAIGKDKVLMRLAKASEKLK